MKICILTGKFGMGHLYAAMAIKQQLENSSYDADIEIIDWFHYASPKIADKYYDFYTFLVNKGSNFYNTWYRLSENKKVNKKPELSRYFMGCFSKLLKEKTPDIIISTLPFCSRIVSLYKEKMYCNIPLITCVTDITGHSEWISKNTDFYLVGSDIVKENFIQKGVFPEKIFATGIPVRLDFIKKSSVENTKHQNCTKNILIMGGGLGMLPDDVEFYEGLNLLPDAKVTVITGKNQKLYQSIYGKYPNIRILGYVENICDYMKSADLIITKPGGITTFEAIHSEVPIIALNPYLQQEVYNAKYIEEMHIGTVVNGSSKKCLEDITNILYHGQLENYRDNIRRIKDQLEEVTLPQVLHNVLSSDTTVSKRLAAIYKNKSKDITVNEKVSFNI